MSEISNFYTFSTFIFVTKHPIVKNNNQSSNRNEHDLRSLITGSLNKRLSGESENSAK